jgi:UDP-glucose 4-epimerase
VLDIRVESDFNFAGNHPQNEALRTPYTFYRNNVNGTAKIYFVVDNTQTYSVDILSGGQTRVEDTGMMISPNLEAGPHVLQIYAEATYNEG